MTEVLNQNDLKARAESQRVLEESQQAGGALGRETQEQERLSKLTPEERKEVKATEERLDSYIQKKDIININEIVRNPSSKKLLSPDALRKAFEALRSVHKEEVKKHVDNLNLAAVRADFTNQLDTVSSGLHEIFNNLQGHIESSGSIDKKTGENLVTLQKEVEEAEASIKRLEKDMNKPFPVQNGSHISENNIA